MKNVLLLLLLVQLPTFQLFANAAKVDSVRIKHKKAFRDVRFFKLDKQPWKAFKEKRFEPTSDYFKPKVDNINNPDLIEDSIYTKAYRKAAFNKTKHRRTDIYYEIGAVVVFVIFMALVLKNIQTHLFKFE